MAYNLAQSAVIIGVDLASRSELPIKYTHLQLLLPLDLQNAGSAVTSGIQILWITD